jgi:purine nucleoside phosphorylase
MTALIGGSALYDLASQKKVENRKAWNLHFLEDGNLVSSFLGSLAGLP